MSLHEKPSFTRSLATTLKTFFCEQRCRACSAPFLPSHAAITRQKEPAGTTMQQDSVKKTAQQDSAHKNAVQQNSAEKTVQQGLAYEKAMREKPFFWQSPPLGPQSLFCPKCAHELARRANGYCPSCGELAAWPALPAHLCGKCLVTPPPWQSFLFHGPYTGLLRHLLLHLKFGNSLAYAHALGVLLAQHPNFRSGLAQDTPFTDTPHLTEVKNTATHSFDIATAIPLHPQRLASRGYNQALEIAKACLTCLGKKKLLVPNILHRTRYTSQQTGLSLAERKKNINGAFCVHKQIEGKHILLMDDVITTGATLEAATRALHKAGAASVHIAVVAKTPRYWLP